ncbi:MAG: dipeptidase, partial [Phycisphaerales bacterium]|nr:dipeptidase [Phycisphaerales bacterium]
MNEFQRYVDSNRDRTLEELKDLLRIPSVSTDPARRPDVARCAEFVAARAREAGLQAEILPTDGHPIVYAERLDAPGAPTVLIYGHYDVQPPDPLDRWRHDPFDPVVEGEYLVARGATDDKGQLFMHVKALEAHLATSGRLPVNVVVLAEGEEEIGSPNLVPFVEHHLNRLRCDVVVISDTGMFAEGLPSLLFSLRGLAYFEIHVRGARSDLHSGEYGGSITNPGNALARIIASLHDAQGRVAIPGFYDDVDGWDEETRRRIAALPHDDEEYRSELGVPALAGEMGYSTLERLWIRPTCDVNGLLCGYTGEGAKTVLPNRAMAKVSFRLVPSQSDARVEDLFSAHVRRVCPEGVTAEVRSLHGGRPWKATVEGPAFEAASRALEEAFGTRPVLMGGGGSI